MARFAVCIVSPPGYSHSAAFREVGDTLVHGLAALGHDVVLGHDPAPAGRRAVVLGSNLLRLARQRPAQDAILYNLEQIEPGSPWLSPELLELLRTHEVWDYSERNAGRYGALALPAPRVVPIGWAPVLERIPPAAREDVDVLFYGSLNDRRRAVLEALMARGLRVEAPYGLYGAARDALIARAKIVLNVHYYEAKVFEIVRVSYLLANRRCVVSERGADPAEERELEAGVAFAGYGALVETCVRLASDPAARARLAEAGRAAFARRDVVEILRAAVGAAGPGAGGRPAPALPYPGGDLVVGRSVKRGEDVDQNPAKEQDYYRGLNRWLLRAVPEQARVLVEVGCAEGRLGAALKEGRPDRRVYGVEREASAAAAARARLDAVFELDVERACPDLPAGSADVLLFGDVLEHLRDPRAAIERLLPLLRPGGEVLCCVPNVQHHSVLTALLRGDFQYQPLGIMDETHVRFFTWASFTKLLLDAGLAPEIVDHVESPPDPALIAALAPALRYAGADPRLAEIALGTYQYVFRGRRLGWERAAEEPITFVACVNDEAQLGDNLRASPCLREGSPHQLVTVRGASGAGEALAAALPRAQHELVVLVHQDVYLPAGWPARFLAQWRAACARHGPVGLAGVYGVRLDPSVPGRVARVGHVVDRFQLLRDGDVPGPVDTLDELLLAVPRDTPLRATPGLGFHMYGSDLGCRARALGLPVVVLDAPCFHNSLYNNVLPAAFHASVAAFREAWADALPVATNAGVVA